MSPPNCTRPFCDGVPTRTVRRGHFWVPGERVEPDGKTYQRGPMFVKWETPEQVTRPYPVVLVHGGGFQGTEWLDTPDGRPAGRNGWSRQDMPPRSSIVLATGVRPCIPRSSVASVNVVEIGL